MVSISHVITRVNTLRHKVGDRLFKESITKPYISDLKVDIRLQSRSLNIANRTIEDFLNGEYYGTKKL